MHSPATSSRYYRTGDEDGISRTDTASAPTPLLCPDPAYSGGERRDSPEVTLSCRGGGSQT